MGLRRIAFLSIAGIVLALCTACRSETLEKLDDERLEAYCRSELEWGSPSLPIASRILYRQALENLSRGEREKATEKLVLAADLTSDYAAPLFSLAKVEFLSGNKDFFPHLCEALRRTLTSFPAAASVALNWGATLTLALSISLLVLLLSLLVKYWGFLEHLISESPRFDHRKSSVRNAMLIAVISLSIARLGAALYIALLLAALWMFFERHEKALVLSLVIVLSAISAISPLSNFLAPAIDPGSTVRRLSLLNERSVNAERLSEIRAVDENRYKAERDFAVGTMMYRLGLYNEARVHLLEAVSVDAHFAPAFVNLGNIYFMQGDYDKALAGYRNAVEIDSTNAIAHYNIGQAYIKKMLFAQSGMWLQRANSLGIERYRASHPALEMRKAVVYEQGFPAKKLWAIAKEEGKERKAIILSEMLQSFLLFPFHRLYALLAVSLIAGIVLARKLSRDRRVIRCENCGLPACDKCLGIVRSVRLCRECTEAIKDVTSLKVMEVLLRTRRQKTGDAKKTNRLCRLPFLPGMTHIKNGRLMQGFLLAFIFSVSVSILAWRANCFENPFSANEPEPGWKLIFFSLIAAASYGISFLSKLPEEPRNYRIFQSEKREPNRDAAKKQDAEKEPWIFLESAPPLEPKKRPAKEETTEEAKPRQAKPMDVPPDPFVGNLLEKEIAPRHIGPKAKKELKENPRKASASDTKFETEDNLIAEIRKGSSWH